MSPPSPLEICPNVLSSSMSWVSLLTYVGLGTFPLFIASYNNLDMLGDQLKSTFMDTDDVFDFIIGIKLLQF